MQGRYGVRKHNHYVVRKPHHYVVWKPDHYVVRERIHTAFGHLIPPKWAEGTYCLLPLPRFGGEGRGEGANAKKGPKRWLTGNSTGIS